MKKILYIANARLPTEKAHGGAIMRQCDAFAKLGHEMILAYANRRNTITESPFSYYGLRKTFPTHRLPALDLVRFGRWGFIVATLSFLPGALFFALHKSADIIYTRDNAVGALLALFMKNVVWEVHLAKKGLCTRLLLRRACNVVFISHGLKQYYKQQFGLDEAKVLVAPSAIDIELFDNVTDDKKVLRKAIGIPKKKQAIGYVGKSTTMGKGKGLEVLLDAFHQLYQENNNIHLLLVGLDDGDVGRFSKQLQVMGIPPDAFTVRGHVPQQEVPNYMKACDCLVLCYPDTEHYRLHMSPIKLFEYMACGVPVVASDLPSVREIVDETSVQFTCPGDAIALVNAIEHVLNNAITSQTCTANAYKVVREKYTWKQRASYIFETAKILHGVRNKTPVSK